MGRNHQGSDKSGPLNCMAGGWKVELFCQWSVSRDDEALQARVFSFWTGFLAWPQGFLLDPDTHRPLPAQKRNEKVQRRLRLIVHPASGGDRWRRLLEASTCSFTLLLTRDYARCAKLSAQGCSCGCPNCACVKQVRTATGKPPYPLSPLLFREREFTWRGLWQTLSPTPGQSLFLAARA